MKKAIKLIFFNLIIIFLFAVIEIFLIFYDKNHLRYDHLLMDFEKNLKIKKTDKDLYAINTRLNLCSMNMDNTIWKQRRQ